jgi:hypothetical protein
VSWSSNMKSMDKRQTEKVLTDLIRATREYRIIDVARFEQVHAAQHLRKRDLPISWNIAPSQGVFAIRFNPKQSTTAASIRCGGD